MSTESVILSNHHILCRPLLLLTPRPGAVAQSPGREAALAWASLAKRSPASSLLAREGAGFGNMSDLTGALLASAQLLPFLSN